MPPPEDCLSAQGGTAESWEAEPAPGRTGLSLLLLVNPVTWKRGDRLWTPARPAWASGEPQHSQRSPGVTSQDTSLCSWASLS